MLNKEIHHNLELIIDRSSTFIWHCQMIYYTNILSTHFFGLQLNELNNFTARTIDHCFSLLSAAVYLMTIIYCVSHLNVPLCQSLHLFPYNQCVLKCYTYKWWFTYKYNVVISKISLIGLVNSSDYSHYRCILRTPTVSLHARYIKVVNLVVIDADLDLM